MGLLTPQTMHEEILALYQEVFQLKRNPGEIQYSEKMAEETHIKILETLKEHLWCRWGSTQLEEPRWRTPRTHAEAEYYAQMQVACDHFSFYWAQQQQSREKVLRVVILAVTSTQEAGSTQTAGAAPGAEGVGVAEGRWLCWWYAQRIQVVDRLLHQVQSDPRGRSFSKTPGTLKQSGFPHPPLLIGRARRPLTPGCTPGKINLRL